MPFYHFRFIEEGGRVVLGEDQDCIDEEEAVMRGRLELGQRSYRQVEVWLRDRRIVSLPDEAQAKQPQPLVSCSLREG
ncbi:MAG: hypothetical protein JO094_14015 [Hyphomicrobiales bacterium]|nr:hypothetical protein [Hyphomicrobiales bacterium]MBV9589490.1 hypothetical protein [Hyphomicrobiales bacterium]MBV9754478.1 hypothetical protein [Hyphomicrobiales bacterium]MBV9975678.1 hypothetical protein [Hyphomicrobiales bacterium]